MDNKRDMMSELGAKTGEDFDRSFLKMMILHHEECRDMARQAQDKAQNKEIRDMAKDMVSKHGQDVEKMREMLETM